MMKVITIQDYLTIMLRKFRRLHQSKVTTGRRDPVSYDNDHDLKDRGFIYAIDLAINWWAVGPSFS